MAMQFKKATKRAAKLRLALIGPAGSGKTFTGLMVATRLSRKVAVIDTEKGSASKYADLFEFDVLELEDFAPQTYVSAIRAAEQAGYEALVIDSLSHAWVGKGGALEMHDNAVARQKGGNSFTAWRDVTPHHNAMIEAIVQCRCHVVMTMRAKTEYVQEKDERSGRSTVRKVGLAPVQRDGLEYEADIVGDMDQDNRLVITKSRAPALSGRTILKPGLDFADEVARWLGDGSAEDQPRNVYGAPETVIHPAPAKPETKPAPAPEPAPEKAKADIGVRFLERLRHKESDMVKAGLCLAGDLQGQIREAGKTADFPEAVTQWNAAHVAVASGWVVDFEAQAREQKAAAASRTPSRDPASSLTPEEAGRLSALLASKGKTWREVAGLIGITDGRHLEKLTWGQSIKLAEMAKAWADEAVAV